jgi:hypothetical protein
LHGHNEHPGRFLVLEDNRADIGIFRESDDALLAIEIIEHVLFLFSLDIVAEKRIEFGKPHHTLGKVPFENHFQVFIPVYPSGIYR